MNGRIEAWIREHTGVALWIGVLVGLHLLSAVAVAVFDPNLISAAADQREYRTIALNLLDHGSFSIAPVADHNPDMMRTPGYPFFVAATYLFDRSGVLLIILQQLMLGVMAVILYLLLRYFAVSGKIALVLSALYLLEPQQWFYSLQTMTETLSSFIFIVLLALAFLAPRMRPLMHTVLYGLLIGLLLLVKPTLAILGPLLLCLLLLIRGRDWKHRFLAAIAAGAIAFVVLTPWLVRDYLVTGTLAFSASPSYVLISGFGTPAQNAIVNVGEPLYNEAHQWAGIVVEGYSARGYALVTQVAKQVVEEKGWVTIALGQLAYAPTVWLSLSVAYAMIGGTAVPASATLAYAIGFWGAALAALLTLAGFVLLLLKKEYRLRALILIAMLALLTLLNVRIAYARTLIPLYPLIFIGIGASVMHLSMWGSRAGKRAYIAP